ncbi:MAG: citrate lyase acyl carrier protein, partial [Phycisphaerae bacterium]|nr:citrate lyase acyl carrier protein [Phycisphaerae bacterium]
MTEIANSAARIATAGRRGTDVRSDCWVQITLAESGGIDLQLKTKVEVMYGEATRKLVREALAELGVKNARVEIEDAGALPWVMLARLEAAVRRLDGRGVTDVMAVPECLPEFVAGAQYPT